ncbi:MAG: glycosyltransferase family 4 protein [Marinosulfonomonas sp.]|nr:glycosyltransferase family 4 protein [Marinosulfonomonas sp.]
MTKEKREKVSVVVTFRHMKILQVGTNFKQGGIQRHILDLTQFLRTQGHHVMVAGAPDVWGGRDIDPDFLPLSLDRVANDSSSVAVRFTQAMKCARELRRFAAKNDFDLVHCHETAPAIVAKMAFAWSGIPKIITFHGSAPDRTRQFARVSKYCADRVVSPSRTTLQSLVDYGVDPEKTKMLGLGITPQAAPSVQKVQSIRSSLQLADTDILCLSLSRLGYQKGIDIMIDVAQQVLAKQSNIVFAVGGTGPLEDEVRLLAKQAGIADRFRFLGSISEVPEYLAAANIFLLTSRWEALPISIVEAFRAGLPVIATDCGGVKELVGDAVGRLCQVGDVDGLTAAVLELAGNNDLRARLAKNAAKLSKSDRFDPDHVHGEFEHFYQSLVAKQNT